MSYKSKNKDFAKKYDKEIRGIAKKNNVDMGVARDMFEANIKNSRTGSDKVYGGGGKVDDDRWSEMGRDYDDLIKAAKEKGSSRRRTVSYPKTALSSSSSGGSRSSRNSSRESSSVNSYIDEINRLAELQKQQAIAGLRKSRDTALSNLNREKADIQPRYYAARNDANTQSKLGAKSFAEYIANRGLANSGENTQARLMQNVALQGQIGELKQQEAKAFDENDRRVTDVNNAYSSDVASARAGVDAQNMQNLIAEHQRIDAIRREQDRYNKEFDYRLDRDSVLDDRYDTQYRDSRSDIDYARNYRTERDSILDNRYNTEYADKRSDIDYARSPENPAYQARLLSNKIAEMNLNYLPQKQKLELTRLKKQIAEIGREKPKTEYEIQLQKLKLAQVNKELENLNNQQNKPDKNEILASTYDMLDSKIQNNDDVTSAKEWLRSNRANVIKDLGITEYNRMEKYLIDIETGGR